MAYIGDKPSQTLASPTSQYFNGTGSATVFTLNRAVNVSEDLEVFVNNIQQEPGVGKSYTATGTTLTFDAPPSLGTANVYVVYRGLAEVTTRLEHDANAALAATTGTFSGDLTVDTNTLYVDSTNNVIGVGTSSPSTTHKLTLNHTANYGGISLKQSGTQIGQIIQEGGTGNVYIDADSSSLGGGLIFRTTGGTERARVTANGITFNGDTAAANALDDYEEGTWTPTILSSGTVSTETNSAHYIKMGRVVMAHVRLDTFSDMTNNIHLAIGGLPFTTGTAQQHAGVGWTNNAVRLVFFYGSAVGNSSVLVYSGGSSGGAYGPFVHSALNANEEFLCMFHYITQ